MRNIRMIIEGDAYEKFSELLELGVKANELGLKFKVDYVEMAYTKEATEIIQGDDLVFMQVDNSYDGPCRTGYSSVSPIPEEVFRGSELEEIIVKQEPSKTGSISDSADGQSPEGKPRVGRPRAKDPLSGAERKKLWKDRHGEQALKKEREYQRDYRKRRKATRKYYLEDGK